MNMSKRIVVIIVMLVIITSCTNQEEQVNVNSLRHTTYKSLDDFLSLVNQKEMNFETLGNTIILFSKDDDMIYETIFIFDETNNMYELILSQLIEPNDNGLNCRFCSCNYPDTDCNGYITVLINDNYLIHKGETMILNFEDRDIDISMKNQSVYIIGDWSCKTTLIESGKVVEQVDNYVSVQGPTISESAPNIVDISIVDNHQEVIYKYKF